MADLEICKSYALASLNKKPLDGDPVTMISSHMHLEIEYFGQYRKRGVAGAMCELLAESPTLTMVQREVVLEALHCWLREALVRYTASQRHWLHMISYAAQLAETVSSRGRLAADAVVSSLVAELLTAAGAPHALPAELRTLLSAVDATLARAARPLRESMLPQLAGHLKQLMYRMAKVGEFDTQRALLRMTLRFVQSAHGPRVNAFLLVCPESLYAYPALKEAFYQIDYSLFIPTSRFFLRVLNNICGLVESVLCESAYLDDIRLHPLGSDVKDSLWLDVNVGASTMTLEWNPAAARASCPLPLRAGLDGDAATLTVHRDALHSIVVMREGGRLLLKVEAQGLGIVQRDELSPPSLGVLKLYPTQDIERADHVLRYMIGEKYKWEVSGEAPSPSTVPQPRYVGAPLSDQGEEEIVPTAAGAKVRPEKFYKVSRSIGSSSESPSCSNPSTDILNEAGVPPPPAATATERPRRKRSSSVGFNTRSGRSQPVSPSSVSTTSLLGLPEKLKNINTFNYYESTERRKNIVKKPNFGPLQEEKYPAKRTFICTTVTPINLNVDEVGSIVKDRSEEEFVNDLYYDALANSKTYDESNEKDQNYGTKNSPLPENNKNAVVDNGNKILPITEIATIDRTIKQSNKLLSPIVLIESLDVKKITRKGKDNIENTVFVENFSVIPDSNERNDDNSNISSSQDSCTTEKVRKSVCLNQSISFEKKLKSFVASKETVYHIPKSDDLNDIYSEKEYNTSIHTEKPIHSIIKRKLDSPKEDLIVQCLDESTLSSEEEEQIKSKNIRKYLISNRNKGKRIAIKGKEEKPLSTNDLFDQIRSSCMTDNVPSKKCNEIAMYNLSSDSETYFQPYKFRRSVSEESSAGGNSNAIKRTKRTVNKVKERSRKKLNNKTKKEHGTKVYKLLETKNAMDDEKMRKEVPTDAGLDTSICFENCVQTEKQHGDIVPVGLQNIEMEEMVPENNVGKPILFLSETTYNDTDMFTKKSLLSATLTDKSSEKKMFSNKHESIPHTKHHNINKKERGKNYIHNKSKKLSSGESNEVKHFDVGQTSESLKPVNITKGSDVNINIIKKNISESTTMLVDSNIDFDEIITEREYRTKINANKSISGNMDSNVSVSKFIKAPSKNNDKVHIKGSKPVTSKKRHSDSEMEMPSMNNVNQIARTETVDHIKVGIKDEHDVNLKSTKTRKIHANKVNKLFEKREECPFPPLVVEKVKRNDGLDLNLSNLSDLIEDVNSYRGKLQRTSKPDATIIIIPSGDQSPAKIASSTPHDKTLKKKSCLTINSSGDNHSDFTSEKSIVTNAYSPITRHGDFNQSPPNVIHLDHESGRHFGIDLENSRDRECILELNSLNSSKSYLDIDNLENDSVRSEKCSKDYISGKGTFRKSANVLKKAISSPSSSPINDVHLLFRNVKPVNVLDSRKEQVDIDAMENDIIQGDLISNRSEDYFHDSASNCKKSANVLKKAIPSPSLSPINDVPLLFRNVKPVNVLDSSKEQVDIDAMENDIIQGDRISNCSEDYVHDSASNCNKSANVLKKAIPSPSSSPINDVPLLFRNVKPMVFSPIMITYDLRSPCHESTSYGNKMHRDLSTEAKRQGSDHDLDIFAELCSPADRNGSAMFTAPLNMRNRFSKKVKSCERDCNKNIPLRGSLEKNENDDKGKAFGGDSGACTDMRAMMQATEAGLVEADSETNHAWAEVVSHALRRWHEVERRHELEHRESLRRLEEQRNRENVEKKKVIQQLTERMLREARLRTSEDLAAVTRRRRESH